jgi:hypothetical protein
MDQLEMAELAFDDVVRNASRRSCDVGKEAGLLVVVEEVEGRAELAVIIIAFVMIVGATSPSIFSGGSLAEGCLTGQFTLFGS